MRLPKPINLIMSLALFVPLTFSSLYIVQAHRDYETANKKQHASQVVADARVVREVADAKALLFHDDKTLLAAIKLLLDRPSTTTITSSGGARTIVITRVVTRTVCRTPSGKAC